MKLPEYFLRFNKKQKNKPHKNISCKNCETTFSGNYCPNCGQSVDDYDKPFSFIFYNFIGDFFAFDTRFLRTFIALVSKPGFLTKQYFEGKRVRYAPPFRIFIFVSFILFLLLQIYTNKGLTTVLDSEFDGKKIGIDSTSLILADSIFNAKKADLDPVLVTKADSALKELGIPIDTIDTTNYKFTANLEIFRDTRDLRQILDKLANKLENDLEKETDPKEKTKIREYIRLCRSPEQAVAKILKYTSWAFFLLLPLFALILKLVYIRRKQNYIRHLIFSIHIHSFIFLVIIFITLLYMVSIGNVGSFSVALGENVQSISSFFLLSVPVYFVIALKKFYGQSWGKAILKFLATSFLYNIVFLTVMIIVFLNALSII